MEENKKIYVIGHKNKPIEEIRKILEVKDDVEIVLVDNESYIPVKDRLKSDTFVRIHEYKINKIEYDYIAPIQKGHIRPYKYHK